MRINKTLMGRIALATLVFAVSAAIFLQDVTMATSPPSGPPPDELEFDTNSSPNISLSSDINGIQEVPVIDSILITNN